MKKRLAIAIESENDSNMKVAEHFAQSAKFIVYEIDENRQILKTETYFNPIKGHNGGTCQLPGYVNQFSVNTIIAGGMGQKAISNFQAFGINVITAPGMNCDDALKQYLEGKLSGYEECAGHEHDHNCG